VQLIQCVRDWLCVANGTIEHYLDLPPTTLLLAVKPLRFPPFNMRGSSLLPKQFRSLGNSDSWLNRNVSSMLLSISGIACQHPIHTIVVIALLASTSYVGLLQESLFDTTGHLSHGRGYVDLDALLVGSRTLELSKQTSWKWQVQDNIALPPRNKVACIALF
jgi:hydroxymethylglutaryl-CoA reductase (NADPH)